MIYPIRATAEYKGEADKPRLVPGIRYVINVEPHPIFKNGNEYQVTTLGLDPPKAHHTEEMRARIMEAAADYPFTQFGYHHIPAKIGYYYESANAFHDSWSNLLGQDSQPLPDELSVMLPF
ncbi:hypothetical protein [Hymenobacter terricola]|uniref:hypothetical protein n=1 Tax=Hymenobacter terricola TaxID=2819236 RepID=UPI001B31781E|nr:hypothetical protein [Hymenobacter terricola]